MTLVMVIRVLSAWCWQVTQDYKMITLDQALFFIRALASIEAKYPEFAKEARSTARLLSEPGVSILEHVNAVYNSGERSVFEMVWVLEAKRLQELSR